ncbi:MAG: c-type cytochrome [Myxococcota bacterium]
MSPCARNFAPALAILLILPYGGAGAEERPIDGAQVYASTCNRCHNFRSPVEFTDARWSVVATHMRIVGGLPADETRAVLAFLRANNNPPPPAQVRRPESLTQEDTDPVSLGRSLVNAKGCVACHTIEGPGGDMGPVLRGVTTRRDEAFIRNQLRDPRLNNARTLMPNLGLSNREIDVIWTYLKSLESSGSP